MKTKKIKGEKKIKELVIKRLGFFIRSILDIIPYLWVSTGLTYYDVGVFRTNDEKDWKQYRNLRAKIARIIEPTYKLK